MNWITNVWKEWISETTSSRVNSDGSVSHPVHQFHDTHGENVRLSADRSTARRVNSFCNGIAFSKLQVRPNEKINLRVTECSTKWLGALEIGFTSCNPFSLSGVLPNDFSDLRKRPGFWIEHLSENYADRRNYADVGTLLSIHFTASGDVMLEVNGQDQGVVLTDVDTRIPLWFMVDVYGQTTAVQFVDPRTSLTNNPMPPTQRSTASLQPIASSSENDGTSISNDSSSECTVCCSRSVDCVLYSCGHMCLCYDCALILHQDGQGLCPICRAPIRDVIRAYRS